jgi:predicted N-formylglutamate amidohydrolase
MPERENLPPPVGLVNEFGSSPYVLLCEHASCFIPLRYEGLGLPESELTRHIAWDIGAANVAKQLSHHLDAPLVLAGYSRLLIDLNRPVTSTTSIPTISELTLIPGNQGLAESERVDRIARYFTPFHSRVTELLDARQASGKPTIVVGVHSFTPVFKGLARPWEAGILFRKSADFGRALVEALGGARRLIVENEPYQIDDESDYAVPVHGEARKLDSVLVELRQDLIADDVGAAHWSHKLAKALHIVGTGRQ